MDWNRRANEFSEFYDQMLAQRKENMTKCSHKTEREFQLIWLAAGRKPKKYQFRVAVKQATRLLWIQNCLKLLK